MEDIDKVTTLEEVRAQIAERERDLASRQIDAGDARTIARVQARDEALERVCAALRYLENSLAEVATTRTRLEFERGTILSELRTVRAERDALAAELRSLRLATREVDRQMDAHDDDPADPEAAPPGAR